MREFTSLSGKWIGQSIQEGFRLTEDISLTFQGNRFTGSGTDVDGIFDLDGEYEPADNGVQITRTYSVAPRNPGQVGYPFIYVGRWDGYQVSGRWMMSTHPQFGGPFEMWPENEETIAERAIEVEQEPETVGHG